MYGCTADALPCAGAHAPSPVLATPVASLARRLSGLEHRLEELDQGTKEVLQASAGGWLGVLQVRERMCVCGCSGMHFLLRLLLPSHVQSCPAEFACPHTHACPALSQAEGEHERQELQQLEEEQGAEGRQEGCAAAPPAAGGTADGGTT